MKSLTSICLIGLVALVIGSAIEPVDEFPPRFEPISSAALASALAPLIVNALNGLVGSLFKPQDYHDTVLYGRSARIKTCGQSCVQITDRGSGITVVGTGSATHDAVGDASQKLFHQLLDKKLLSLFDLCHLHISFPHPDETNCAGIQISTCDLISVVEVTKRPCVNKMGDRFCKARNAKGLCDEHHHDAFMMENCHKECTNGCKEENNDPCAFKP